MTASAILLALWPSVRRILGRLGRWVIALVARKGVQGVATYLEMRTEVFASRRRKARAKLRRRWLAGRIQRWRAAARWLRSEEGGRFRGKVVELAAERAARELPEHADGETFDRWRGRRAA